MLSIPGEQHGDGGAVGLVRRAEAYLARKMPAGTPAGDYRLGTFYKFSVDYVDDVQGGETLPSRTGKWTGPPAPPGQGRQVDWSTCPSRTGEMGGPVHLPVWDRKDDHFSSPSPPGQLYSGTPTGERYDN